LKPRSKRLKALFRRLALLRLTSILDVLYALNERLARLTDFVQAWATCGSPLHLPDLRG
jgi:hypothetical protein